MNTLILVNCQNDFITGTMTSKGARTVIENLKNFIKNNYNQFERIIFTAQWRTINDYDFKQNGGTKNQHCIQFTPGACIEPKLLKLVQSLKIPYDVFTYKDQTGFEDPLFRELDEYSDAFGKRYYLNSNTSSCYFHEGYPIILAGLTEDLQDGIKYLLEWNIVPKIYLPGVIKSDKLLQYLKINNIENVKQK